MTNTKAVGHQHTQGAPLEFNYVYNTLCAYRNNTPPNKDEINQALAANAKTHNQRAELLEALEICLDAIQPYYDSDDDGSKEAQASNTALAAIAKAKGGAK